MSVGKVDFRGRSAAYADKSAIAAFAALAYRKPYSFVVDLYYWWFRLTEDYVLLVAEGCPVCPSVEREVKRRLGGGVKVLDVTKENEGASLVMALGDYRVPMLVKVTRHGDRTTVCKVEDSGEVGRCAEVREVAE